MAELLVYNFYSGRRKQLSGSNTAWKNRLTPSLQNLAINGLISNVLLLIVRENINLIELKSKYCNNYHFETNNDLIYHNKLLYGAPAVRGLIFSIARKNWEIYQLTLTRPLRRKLRMMWFSTFPRWRTRVFWHRTSLTLLRFFMRIFWKIPI